MKEEKIISKKSQIWETISNDISQENIFYTPNSLYVLANRKYIFQCIKNLDAPYTLHKDLGNIPDNVLDESYSSETNSDSIEIIETSIYMNKSDSAMKNEQSDI